MVSITATDLPRFMKCNGSAFMEKHYYDTDMSARDEGNAAHWVAEQMVAGKPDDALIGKPAFNGFVVTEEMVAHTREYVNYGKGIYELDTSWGNIRGRADRVHSTNELLIIDDYKYGWSIVEPELNWTLISHAIAMIHEQHETVILRIFQPRPWHPDGPIRQWTLTSKQLMEYRRRIVAALANPVDELVTGPQCHRCPTIVKCPAARMASMNAIDTVSHTYEDEIPNDALSVELDNLDRAAKILKSRQEALTDMATSRIREGGMIPNYMIKQQMANRSWSPDITPEFLQTMTGVDVSKVGMVTPAEAERRGVTKELVKMWTDRPVTGYKLNRIDPDKEVRKVFKDGLN
jgi:hypothetical protein